MTNHREKLAALGFSRVEIDAVEFCLLRMGVMACCEHDRPKFVECYELDADGSINEARWQKSMREMGFRSNAISLAEHALGLYGDGGTA